MFCFWIRQDFRGSKFLKSNFNFRLVWNEIVKCSFICPLLQLYIIYTTSSVVEHMEKLIIEKLCVC